MSRGPAAREPDSSGLRAVSATCTLDRSPGRSHTRGVIDRSAAIVEAHGVAVDGAAR